MRNAFADELMALAARDERIVLLSGDIGNRIFDPFKQAFPDRFYNCGVAEASMMSLAAGLALTGLRPVVYTITTFATYRCFEQIRVGVAYHDAPVIIVGTGSGLSYASLGPTHHSLEDMAILRAVPGMTVLAPCDSNELRAGLVSGEVHPHGTIGVAHARVDAVRGAGARGEGSVPWPEVVGRGAGASEKGEEHGQRPDRKGPDRHRPSG